MSERGSSEGDSQPAGLHRLPPGRHGLPREFVSRNQRDRLAAGIIAAVAEHGYHDTTITQISAAAGVSRRTFYSYFDSKQACFFATYDMIVEHLRTTGREAADAADDWPAKVRARFGASLEAFAANPDLARFILIAPARAGVELSTRYGAAIADTLGELTEGMPSSIDAPSQSVQESLLGGCAGIIVRQVEAGEGEKLPDLLPDLVQLFLSPFLGPAEAVRAAQQS